jgi:hypothetical protein
MVLWLHSLRSHLYGGRHFTLKALIYVDKVFDYCMGRVTLAERESRRAKPEQADASRLHEQADSAKADATEGSHAQAG